MDWNKKSLLDRIIERWGELDGPYNRVNPNRQSITRYFRSDEIVETNDKGNLVGQNIYNGSGSWFSRMMATGFQGSLVSKNIPWIRYQMEELELKGIDEIDIWLQDIKEHMSMAYQNSNFYNLQPQFTHDGVTTGSPVMFGEEKILEQRTMWMPQHYSKVRLYYDKYNEVEGCIVKDDTWTAKQIVETFAKNDNNEGTKRKEKFSISVNTAYEMGSLEQVFTVYRATFKVTDIIWDGKDENKFKKPVGRDWTWLSVYFLEVTDKEKANTPLNDNIGYFSQPFAVWNFDKKPWEVSSRTPAWYAIWDCLSLQQMDKNFLENQQLKNRPPIIALDSMKNRLRLSPEGKMYASKAEYESSPKTLDMIGDIKLDREVIEIRIDALKRWFMIDFFTKFTELTQTNKQPVTATQIWQMVGEKATMLSPAIETHSTYLEVIDARMMDIEIQKGMGPFELNEMANITDIIQNALQKIVKKTKVNPVFIGPLAQAQKASQALQPIESTMEAMDKMFARNPQLLMKYRWYKLSSKIEDALDFPQDVIVPEDEYDEMVAADNEAKAKQQEQLMAIEMAKAAPSVSGPVDETSVLAGVAGGAG